MADPPLLSSGYSTCHLVILDRQPGGQVCLVCQHAFWENVHSTHCAFILGERNPTVHKDERCLLVCWCAHTCICVWLVLQHTGSYFYDNAALYIKKQRLFVTITGLGDS